MTTQIFRTNRGVGMHSQNMFIDTAHVADVSSSTGYLGGHSITVRGGASLNRNKLGEFGRWIQRRMGSLFCPRSTKVRMLDIIAESNNFDQKVDSALSKAMSSSDPLRTLKDAVRGIEKRYDTFARAAARGHPEGTYEAMKGEFRDRLRHKFEKSLCAAAIAEPEAARNFICAVRTVLEANLERADASDQRLRDSALGILDAVRNVDGKISQIEQASAGGGYIERDNDTESLYTRKTV